MTEAVFVFIIFCISMAGVVLRKNVIMALLCLFLGNIAGIIMLHNSVLAQGGLSEVVTVYFMLLGLMPLSLVGVVLIMNYFESSKTIMHEEMKSWLE